MTLLEAPDNICLKVRDFLGGDAVRRRLLSLGFHRNDVVRLDGRAPFKGPVLVWNVTSGAQVALGRSVAQKIVVDADHGKR